METTVTPRRNFLYPLLVAASLLAIVFSLLGIAAITGRLPAAFAADESALQGRAVAEADGLSTAYLMAHRPELVSRCPDCGVVELVRRVDVWMAGDGAALREGRIGRLMAGPEIPAMPIWRINVRMDGGQLRSVSFGAVPAVRTGDRVKLVDSGVVRIG